MSIYYHNHHIIPKHMGGSDDPSNIVKLTVEQHAEAHKKLWEDHGNEYDYIAWKALSKLITKEEARREAVIASNKRRKYSTETRAKLAEGTRRVFKNPELRQKYVDARNNLSPEVKLKISLAIIESNRRRSAASRLAKLNRTKEIKE
jgi:hypothetical protein